MGVRINRGAIVGSALVAGLLVAACGGSSQPSASGSQTSASQSPSGSLSVTVSPGSVSPASSGQVSGSETVKQIVPAMDAAVASAQSVHMAGSTQSGSQTITFNVGFYGQTDVSGLFAQNGASFSILVVSGQTYVKLNASFLKLVKAPASACSLVCGKYVQLPSSEASQITGSLSLSGLSKQAFGSLPASVTDDTSDMFVPATFDGQAVLEFHGGGYTIDVARDSPHYPLRVADSTRDSIVFSDWNSVTAPTAPPASSVVNLSQIG